MKNRTPSQIESTTQAKNEDMYKVPGLEKGLSVLEMLSESLHGVTLLNIKNRLNLSASSCYRILSTLVRLGYVNLDEEAKIYTLSKKMLTVGFRVLGEHDLQQKVLPRLRELRDEVRESVFFGVLGEQKGIFIEQAQGIYPFKFVVSPGSSFELHSSAAGKAILSRTCMQLREYYINRMNFERYTPNTITDREMFCTELEKVLSQGYALDMEETLRGVVCVGAPIVGYDGNALGAIWVSGPIDRLNDDNMASVIHAVMRVTDEISIQMGYCQLSREN